jgi:hypothetical protein
MHPQVLNSADDITLQPNTLDFKVSMKSVSHVRDVVAIVHPQMCDGGCICVVNMGRQGILCLLAVKNGVGVAT